MMPIPAEMTTLTLVEMMQIPAETTQTTVEMILTTPVEMTQTTPVEMMPTTPVETMPIPVVTETMVQTPSIPPFRPLSTHGLKSSTLQALALLLSRSATSMKAMPATECNPV